MSYSKNLLGGTNNYSDGYTSIISGGELNTVSSSNTYQTIGGGWHNSTAERFVAIGGGQYNFADGYCSVIMGGLYNTSDGYASVIIGGNNNKTNASASGYQFIGGGQNNTNNGSYSVIVGGYGNVIVNAPYTNICGGFNNTLSSGGDRGNILGGHNNTCLSSLGGGGFNNINGYFGSCGGGWHNTILGGNYPRICGGDFNTINSTATTAPIIHGGSTNTVNATFGAILGGTLNVASGAYSYIGGGAGNTTTGYCSTADGYYNTATGDYSVADGYQSLARLTGQYAFSSSSFNTNVSGGCQFTRVVFNCISVNGASANLASITGSEYTLAASTNYLIILYLVASQANGVGSAMFIRDIGVSVTSGSVATIINETNSYIQNASGYGGITTSIVGSTLRISFVGIAGQTVRAVGTIEARELTY